MKRHLIRAALPLAALGLLSSGYESQARTHQSDGEQQYRFDRGDEQEHGSRSEHRRRGASSEFKWSWPRVSGEIERAKKVELRGKNQEHVAVMLTTEHGGHIVADLGPGRNLRDLELTTGDWISARGPIMRINDQLVMIAKEVEADGQVVQIRRPFPGGHQSSQQAQTQSGQTSQQASRQTLSGQVQTVKELKVKGTGKTHQLVRVKTQEGQQIVADLGTKRELRELNLTNGQQVTIQGRQLRVNGKPFLLADQISTDGKTVQIDREFMSAIPASRAGQRQNAQADTQSIKGEVVVKGELLKVDRDGFYIVRSPNGQEVHMIVAEDMNRGFNIGDQIQAQVKPDGSVTSISKAGGASANPSKQSSSNQPSDPTASSQQLSQQ